MGFVFSRQVLALIRLAYQLRSLCDSPYSPGPCLNSPCMSDQVCKITRLTRQVSALTDWVCQIRSIYLGLKKYEVLVCWLVIRWVVELFAHQCGLR